MNLPRTSFVVFLIAFFPCVASAFEFDACQFTGQASVIPLPPSTSEPIGVKLNVANSNSIQFPHPEYQYYWFKQSVAGANTFVFDVILTNDTTTFPGYAPVGELDQNWGFIGPLPAGPYKLLGTVNVYDPSTGTISPQCDPAMWGPAQKEIDLTVFEKSKPPLKARLVEFYSPSRDDYFLTMDGTESQTLDNTPGWERTGEQFFAFVDNPQVYSSFYSERGTVARYYGLPSVGLNTHLYTFVNSAEADSLSPGAWAQEFNELFGIWQPLTSTGTCPPTTVPVYRFWDGRPDAHHRWTINPDIRQEMLARGWIPEGYGPDGVIMCSPTI